MSERRKIVIQTGNDADDSLPTPHFDTEATLTARPVVPLAEGVAGQAYASRGPRAGQSWSPLLLVLIVVGAVGLGVATGLGIGFYKNRQAAAPPVVSQSPAPTPDSSVVETVEPPAQTPLPTPEQEEARASVPSVEEEPSIRPKDEKPERAVKDEKGDRDEGRRATPPVVTEKRPASDDGDEAFEDNADEVRRAEKQRRREERRERRRRERDLEQRAEFPRDVERAGREQINRIRDIFEGRQP